MIWISPGEESTRSELLLALRFPEKRGSSREIPVRLELQRGILAYLGAAGIWADVKDGPLFRSTVRKTKQLTGNGPSD